MMTVRTHLMLGAFFGCTFLASTTASAIPADHVYEVAFDGTSYSESYSGDLNLEQGGTVQLRFSADTNDYWDSMSGGSFWSALYLGNSGTRHGDYSWTYSLDGSTVDSVQVLNNGSSFAHFINDIGVYSGMFDLLTIDYTLNSSTTGDANALISDPSFWWNPLPFTASYVDNAEGSVPAPATLALLGLGLFGLGLQRRRARPSA